MKTLLRGATYPQREEVRRILAAVKAELAADAARMEIGGARPVMSLSDIIRRAQHAGAPRAYATGDRWVVD